MFIAAGVAGHRLSSPVPRLVPKLVSKHWALATALNTAREMIDARERFMKLLESGRDSAGGTGPGALYEPEKGSRQFRRCQWQGSAMTVSARASCPTRLAAISCSAGRRRCDGPADAVSPQRTP